jgi:hypothetical protein
VLVKLRKTIIAASLLFAFDAFYLNQFLVVMLFIFIGIPVFLVKLFLRRRDIERRRLLLARAAVYGCMVILIIAAFFANNAFAEHQAKRVIAACEQFRAKTGAYPEKLAQLVPDYLGSIPKAKPLLMIGSGFQYFARPDNHELLYTTVPPYGRRGYQLEQKKWRSLHD